MIYRIEHTTEYKYSSRVSHCYNLAHLIPRNANRQKRLNNRIDVAPVAAAAAKRSDYFGNLAYHFEIQKPHTTFSITPISEVDTRAQGSALELDFGTSCAEARRQLADGKDEQTLLAREFILDSPMIRHSAALREFAAPLFSDNRPLLSAVMDLTQKIYKEFEYSPSATTISTPLEEVLATKKGVCQDFAHLQIACLRALGFPAKYVSGYIETLPAPGTEKLVGSDASHAWISVYSPGEGWFEFDPTNNCLVGEQHIITAWGRDYFDVTPLRGVIYGGGESPILSVAVDVRRIESERD